MVKDSCGGEDREVKDLIKSSLFLLVTEASICHSSDSAAAVKEMKARHLSPRVELTVYLTSAYF